MAKEADPDKQNNPVVDDEYSREIRERNIEQLEKELGLHKKNLEDNTKGKVRFENMWDRDKRVYSMMINNPKKIEPAYEYELLDEFWELRKQQLVEKYEEDAHRSESRLAKYDADEKAIKEQIESCEKKLAEYKEEGD